MSWNRPFKGCVDKSREKGKNTLQRIFIFIACVSVFGICLLIVVCQGRDVKTDLKQDEPAKRVPESSIKTPRTAVASHQSKSVVPEDWKEGIAKAITNSLKESGWEIPHLAPDDPEHILHTKASQELATLLSIEPGEDIPPFPFDFMTEEDTIAAAKGNGEAIVTYDGGNKDFLDSLKKWKVTLKETDDENLVAYKQLIVDGQLELMRGIEAGETVNSMIRAAYEFRKRAFEVRSEMLQFIQEESIDNDGVQDREVAEKQLALVNEKLVREGIKPIHKSEVVEGYEEFEEMEE